MYQNPIIKMDYPDIDVIRVRDTYYMISTTMHFMPGCEILRSYDLANWEIAGHVYETLDNTPAQQLTENQNIYGQGMWAPSFRYHKGMFYICFSANDTQKTYLYKSKKIEGPWHKQYIDGFYHDCSLLFDDDERVYIVYGNNKIHLTELEPDLSGPKKGGINRIIVEDKGNHTLGYEGSHIYKINGRYYVFFIHSLPDKWFRTEACFSSDSLEGEFTGGDVLQDDMEYRNSGVAQGGIIDTPNGDWYGILFQDRGAVGRCPVLIPVHWQENQPIFGENGKIPHNITVQSTKPDYSYEPLFSSDDFRYEPDETGKIHLKKVWQWNHNPNNEYWSVTERPGALRLHSGKICQGLLQSYNTLTQRTMEPSSAAWVTVDGALLKNGDFTGICAFQGCYGAIALSKENNKYFLTMFGKPAKNDSLQGDFASEEAYVEYEKIPLNSSVITLKATVDYRNAKDEAAFFYRKNEKWLPLGISHKLYFKLDHFTGCRFGLFYFSTKEKDGIADFMNFHYEPQLLQ